jgi:hypothetical protein
MSSAMAKESMTSLAERLRKSLDTVVLVTLLSLLAVVLVVYLMSSGKGSPPVSESAPGELPAIFPSDNSRTVENIFTGAKKIEDNDRFKSLYRIFQIMSAQERGQIAQQVDVRYGQALALFQAGQLEEARAICVENLDQLPSHRKSEDLQRSIDETLAAQAATNPDAPQP